MQNDIVYAYFDGSYKNIQRMMITSFVVYDKYGTVLHQSSKIEGNVDITSQKVEQKAFNRLINFLVQNNYKKVVVRGDNLGVIETAKYECCRSFTVLYDLCKNFRFISFEHIPREQNYYADYLCNLAYKNRIKKNDIHMYL